MNLKKTVVIAAAAGALTALAIPAMAEITPFGQIRLLTGYQQTDTRLPGSSVGTDVFLKLSAQSRVGVKASDGPMSAVIELGIPNGQNGTANIYTRLLFATYKFSEGTLLFGQDYSKTWNPTARIGFNDSPSNDGLGNIYDGRLPQVRFVANNGLYVAAIQPASTQPVAALGSTGLTGITQTLANDKQKVLIPKLNVGYDGKVDTVGYGVGAVYQTFRDSNTINKQINSYYLYARANMTSGPFEAKVNLAYGENVKNAGFVGLNGYSATKGNEKTIEGYVQGSYTVSPMLKLNAIVGGQSNDRDDYAKADSRMAYTVNGNITIAKGFSITPEFSITDEMKSSANVKQGIEYLSLAKLQYEF